MTFIIFQSLLTIFCLGAAIYYQVATEDLGALVFWMGLAIFNQITLTDYMHRYTQEDTR